MGVYGADGLNIGAKGIYYRDSLYVEESICSNKMKTFPGSEPSWTKLSSPVPTGLNYALSFDGDDDYAYIPSLAALDFALQSFSICFWLKLNNDIADGAAILCKDAAASRNDIYIKYNAVGSFLQVKVGKVVTSDASTSSASLYINNVLAGNDSGAKALVAYEASIYLASCIGTFDNASMLIDELRIYDRELSVSERSVFYHDGLGATHGAEAFLIDSVTLSGADVNIEVAGYTFSTGEDVYIKDVVGTTELNGNTYTITVVDADNFTLDDTDPLDFSAYVSSGCVSSEADLICGYHFDTEDASPVDNYGADASFDMVLPSAPALPAYDVGLLADVFRASGVLVPLFDNTVLQSFHFSYNLPVSYKLGTDIVPKITWGGLVAGTENVRWALEYTIIKLSEAVPQTTVIEILVPPQGAKVPIKSSFAAISGTSIDEQNIEIICHLFRYTSACDDLYEGGAFVNSVSFMYEKDAEGMLTSSSKF